MQKYVKMTEDEYNDLLTQTPSAMLQQTSDNYKQKLDEAYKKIAQLEAALSTYIIGGAKPREPEIVVETTQHERPNSRWKKHEVKLLTDNIGSDSDLDYFVEQLGRTEAAIAWKIHDLGLVIKNRKISHYKVAAYV